MTGKQDKTVRTAEEIEKIVVNLQIDRKQTYGND